LGRYQIGGHNSFYQNASVLSFFHGLNIAINEYDAERASGFFCMWCFPYVR